MNNLEVGIWVSGFLGFWAGDHIGRNNSREELTICFVGTDAVMGKREGGKLPTNPHGPKRSR
jgi:hypothetical protein